jgi:hypothetical protein
VPSALLLLLAISNPVRPFPEERELLDRRLETLRRILPDGPNPAADTALVRDLGASAHLTGLDALARPPLESGKKGETIVDVAALGRLPDLDRFFRNIALSYRPIDVEALTLAATTENVVHLTAVLHFPYRPTNAPLPAPPEGTRSRVAGIPKPQADAYVRDTALALAKSDAIVSLRRGRRNPRLFLSELAAAVRDRPVVLTGANLADEFLVRGITIGEGPARALESRFERGFFRITSFLVARHGACRQFEVRGQAPVAGIDAELPLPTEDPFGQAESACRTDRDTGKSYVVKAAPKKPPAKGTLTLRVRDADVADVFLMLNLLGGGNYVVDGDVQGRLTVDLSRVTAEEALAAILKGTDLRAVDLGGVHRITASKPPPSPRPASPSPAPSPPPPSGGPSMRFSVKRADVRDVLAAMTDVDPGQASLGPAGALGRVSLWARDAPLADVRSAVVNSAGLTERVEEGRRILERHPGSGEEVAPVAGTTPDTKLVFRPQDLSLAEMNLAGLIGDGESWIALAYTPTGVLTAYRTGDRLADATIRSVDSTDVILDTDDGPVRLAIAPLSP